MYSERYGYLIFVLLYNRIDHSVIAITRREEEKKRAIYFETTWSKKERQYSLEEKTLPHQGKRSSFSKVATLTPVKQIVLFIRQNKETSAIRRERKSWKERSKDTIAATSNNSCEVAFSVATTSSFRALSLTNCIDDKSPRVSGSIPGERVSTSRWREVGHLAGL